MAPKETEELFVKQAEVYRKARPRNPEELYSFLASLTPSHELAWDVGTGNGQAAAMVCAFLNSRSDSECATVRFFRVNILE